MFGGNGDFETDGACHNRRDIGPGGIAADRIEGMLAKHDPAR
jgi:hypothetical protein